MLRYLVSLAMYNLAGFGKDVKNNGKSRDRILRAFTFFPGKVKGDLWKVEQFDALGEFVTMGDIKKKILVSSNIQQHIDSLKEYADLGFQKIMLHNVDRNQEEFINGFGEKVLPRL